MSSPVPETRPRLLILGGTAEARALANRLTSAGRYEVITSLAGVTQAPIRPEGTVRSGGFGGVAGLRDFLTSENIAVVADATHPFAARISAHADTACAEAVIPCVRLDRPAWVPEPGDKWRSVTGVAEAAAAISSDSTALVTIGRQDIAAFLARNDIRLIARMIEPPDGPVGAHAEILLARPPFTIPEERALMRDRQVDVLVTKNSGGAATEAKLTAARELGLPVIMIARPEKPDVPSATSLDAMIELIADALC